jgi:hypothetical protein
MITAGCGNSPSPDAGNSSPNQTPQTASSAPTPQETAADPVPSDFLTPASGQGRGLRAEYFVNANFSGTPEIDRTDPYAAQRRLLPVPGIHSCLATLSAAAAQPEQQQFDPLDRHANGPRHGKLSARSDQHRHQPAVRGWKPGDPQESP